MQMSLQDAATVLLQHLLQHLFYFILHVRPVLLNHVVRMMCTAVSEELVYLLEERLELQEQVSCFLQLT